MNNVKSALRRSVVLSYHGVGDVPEESDPNRLVTSVAHLTSHIQLFKRRGYRFVAARDLPFDAAPSEPTVVLTFDDGWRDAVTAVAPLLQRLGVVGSFYVNPELWGAQHADVSGEEGTLLTASETKQLHDAGMEVGSHSLAHRDMRSLSAAELDGDLRRSKEMIEDAVQAPCTTFAYPFGLFGDREMAAVEKAGYELALAWGPGPWRRFAIPRIPAPPRHGASRMALKMLGIRRPVRLA